MKQTSISILIGFLCISCDPVYRAEIQNQTDQQILIEVAFDRQELEKSWGGRPYLPFIRSYPNDGSVDNAILFDTVNLINTYRISPGSSFPLETGIGHHPDYGLFKSLRIIYGDTLSYRNREEIAGAFRNIENRHWVTIVK